MHKTTRRLMAGTAFLLAALGIPGVSAAALMGTLEQITPIFTVYTQGTDFRTFSDTNPNAAVGDVTAPLQAISIDPDAGCQASDFAGFSAGNIALIRRGTCFFSDKVNNAALAGAVGALIFNSISGDPVFGLLVNPTSIPALTITDTLGQALLAQLAQGAVTIHLAVAQVPEPATLALLAIGIAGLALSRRRRDRRSLAR